MAGLNGPRRDLRNHYEARMEPDSAGLRAAVDGEMPGAEFGCVHSSDAAGVFCVATDPRMLQTIDAINRSPRDGGLVSDGLVFRYDVAKTPDGLKGTEGTFNLCTFWLVEALTRAGSTDPEALARARIAFRADVGIRESFRPVR